MLFGLKELIVKVYLKIIIDPRLLKNRNWNNMKTTKNKKNKILDLICSCEKRKLSVNYNETVNSYKKVYCSIVVMDLDLSKIA